MYVIALMPREMSIQNFLAFMVGDIHKVRNSQNMGKKFSVLKTGIENLSPAGNSEEGTK